MTHAFGTTGLEVSRIGYGAGALGAEELSERHAEALLMGVFDRGISLIDTARSYGASEERIGRFFRNHPQQRQRAVISTKIGYGILGLADWTGRCITAGVDAALERLSVEELDICHFHSCPLEVLERGEILDALEKAARAGKVRVAAYSGDGAALYYAVTCGRFGSVQASYNLTDRANAPALTEAAARGLGVILKRPLANAAWKYGERPEAPDVASYWERFQALQLEVSIPPAALALRFSAYFLPAHSILLGTRSLVHLDEALRALQDGPLSGEVLSLLETRYREVGAAWPAMI
jgi:aryl-alcohol dehydrogenase-like predicted oxidoreductase